MTDGVWDSFLVQQAAEMPMTSLRKADVQGISFIRGIRDFRDGCHHQKGILLTNDLNDQPIIIRVISLYLERRYHLGVMQQKQMGDLADLMTMFG